MSEPLRQLEECMFLCNDEFMVLIDSGDEEIVSRFNNYINTRDINGLSSLMTDTHVFMDSVSTTVAGKNACLRAWKGFFLAFPDYRNVFEHVSTQDEMIVVTGYSTCSDARLEGPSIWVVGLSDGLVSKWQVLDDTMDNREALGLDGPEQKQ